MSRDEACNVMHALGVQVVGPQRVPHRQVVLAGLGYQQMKPHAGLLEDEHVASAPAAARLDDLGDGNVVNRTPVDAVERCRPHGVIARE